jgi:hypothetical protein
MIRSVPANSSDSIYCTVLAQNAVHAAMAGLCSVLSVCLSVYPSVLCVPSCSALWLRCSLIFFYFLILRLPSLLPPLLLPSFLSIFSLRLHRFYRCRRQQSHGLVAYSRHLCHFTVFHESHWTVCRLLLFPFSSLSFLSLSFLVVSLQLFALPLLELAISFFLLIPFLLRVSFLAIVFFYAALGKESYPSHNNPIGKHQTRRKTTRRSLRSKIVNRYRSSSYGTDFVPHENLKFQNLKFQKSKLQLEQNKETVQ